MDPATINNSSVSLAVIGGGGVTGTVTYSAQQAIFTPAAPLTGSTGYRGTITTGARSVTGIALAAAHQWTFNTVALPIGQIAFPMTLGKHWLYSDTTRGTACTSTGCSNAYFGGRTVLLVDSILTLSGETASRVRRFRVPRSMGNFDVQTFYLAQRASGLARYNVSAAAWRTVLSSTSSTFTNGAFLLAGGPVHAADHTLSTESVTVPASVYSAVSARHAFTQTGQFAPADIFETERESFADGVGLVLATQSYSFDDNDPQGLDQSSFTRFELLNVDTFQSPALAIEAEPNDSGTTVLAALADSVIISGNVLMSDAAAVVANAAAVTADSLGVRRVHDWYRLVAFRTGTLRISLVAERTNVDLDLYLLQMPAAAWTQVAASTQAAGTAESIVIGVTAGQMYYVAVQAWNTAGGGRTNYWLFVR